MTGLVLRIAQRQQVVTNVYVPRYTLDWMRVNLRQNSTQ